MAEHKMDLIKTYASGAELWSCFECGREQIVKWYPQFKRIVLNEGLIDIVHTGCKGIRLGVEVSQASEDVELPDELKH